MFLFFSILTLLNFNLVAEKTQVSGLLDSQVIQEHKSFSQAAKKKSKSKKKKPKRRVPRYSFDLPANLPGTTALLNQKTAEKAKLERSIKKKFYKKVTKKRGKGKKARKKITWKRKPLRGKKRALFKTLRVKLKNLTRHIAMLEAHYQVLTNQIPPSFIPNSSEINAGLTYLNSKGIVGGLLDSSNYNARNHSGVTLRSVIESWYQSLNSRTLPTDHLTDRALMKVGAMYAGHQDLSELENRLRSAGFIVPTPPPTFTVDQNQVNSGLDYFNSKHIVGGPLSNQTAYLARSHTSIQLSDVVVGWYRRLPGSIDDTHIANRALMKVGEMYTGHQDLSELENSLRIAGFIPPLLPFRTNSGQINAGIDYLNSKNVGGGTLTRTSYATLSLSIGATTLTSVVEDWYRSLPGAVEDANIANRALMKVGEMYTGHQDLSELENRLRIAGFIVQQTTPQPTFNLNPQAKEFGARLLRDVVAPNVFIDVNGDIPNDLLNQLTQWFRDTMGRDPASGHEQDDILMYLGQLFDSSGEIQTRQQNAEKIAKLEIKLRQSGVLPGGVLNQIQQRLLKQVRKAQFSTDLIQRTITTENILGTRNDDAINNLYKNWVKEVIDSSFRSEPVLGNTLSNAIAGTSNPQDVEDLDLDDIDDLDEKLNDNLRDIKARVDVLLGYSANPPSLQWQLPMAGNTTKLRNALNAFVNEVYNSGSTGTINPNAQLDTTTTTTPQTTPVDERHDALINTGVSFSNLKSPYSGSVIPQMLTASATTDIPELTELKEFLNQSYEITLAKVIENSPNFERKSLHDTGKGWLAAMLERKLDLSHPRYAESNDDWDDSWERHRQEDRSVKLSYNEAVAWFTNNGTSPAGDALKDYKFLPPTTPNPETQRNYVEATHKVIGALCLRREELVLLGNRRTEGQTAELNAIETDLNSLLVILGGKPDSNTVPSYYPTQDERASVVFKPGKNMYPANLTTTGNYSNSNKVDVSGAGLDTAKYVFTGNPDLTDDMAGFLKQEIERTLHKVKMQRLTRDPKFSGSSQAQEIIQQMNHLGLIPKVIARMDHLGIDKQEQTYEKAMTAILRRIGFNLTRERFVNLTGRVNNLDWSLFGQPLGVSLVPKAIANACGGATSGLGGNTRVDVNTCTFNNLQLTNFS